MLIFTDGCHVDNFWALIYALKSRKKIDAVVVTPNGWSNGAQSLITFLSIIKWFGRNIPVIIGALYSLEDFEENFEVEPFIQGRMFGEIIPQEEIFDNTILYSYVSWIPVVDVPQRAYQDTYMDKIMEIVDSLDEIHILSLGSLTDVALLVNKLECKGELDKIQRIMHLGGGNGKCGNITTIDRSIYASVNDYIDPRAADIILKKLGDKTIWIPDCLASSTTFEYKKIRQIVIDNPTPESILLCKICDEIVKKDNCEFLALPCTVALLAFLDNRSILGCKRKCVSINTNASVVHEFFKEETVVTYTYDNHLAEMSESECGKETKIVCRLDTENIEKNFYDMLSQNVNGPSTFLKRPLGMYKFEDVTTLDS